MILKIPWHECKKKTPPTKKTLSKKKKLKIGVKLQKNLDKNKFTFTTKISKLLKNLVYILSIKKGWSGEEKKELRPTPLITHYNIIPHAIILKPLVTKNYIM